MKLLDNKWLMVALFCLAVVVKSVLLRTYLYIDGDRSLQLAAAIQWAHGFGYTIPEVTLADIHTVHHRLLLEWPPLYSALMVPLLWITDYDVTASSCMMDTAGAFLYLLAIWRLAVTVGFPPVIQLIILGFKSTEIYEGFQFSYPTDFFAAACWFWAIYFFMQYLERPGKMNMTAIVICLGATFLFRYVYLTTLPVLPVLLWWNGYRHKNPEWRRSGVMMTLALFVTVIGYLSFNKIQTGSFTYLETWDKGFYLEKLASSVPLLWQAISHVTFVLVQLEQLFRISYGHLNSVLQASSFIVLLLLVIGWMRKVNPLQIGPVVKSSNWFFIPAVWVSAVIIGTLAALSIRINFPIDASGGTWSYLVEVRYFHVPLLVVLFALLWLVFVIKWKQTKWQQFFRVMLVSACIFQMAHTGWLLEKRIPLLAVEQPEHPQAAAARRKALQSLFQEGKKNGDEVILLTKDYGSIQFALDHDVMVCRQIRTLDETTTIGIREPATLIIMLNDADYKKQSRFLDKYHFAVRNRLFDEVQLVTRLKPSTP